MSTASREPRDDARRRHYCRILFDGCDPQPPSHRQTWSTRIGGPRPRFAFFSRFAPWSATRATTSADRAIRSDCAPASGQSARSLQLAALVENNPAGLFATINEVASLADFLRIFALSIALIRAHDFAATL